MITAEGHEVMGLGYSARGGMVKGYAVENCLQGNGSQKLLGMQHHDNRKADSGGMATRVEMKTPYPGSSTSKVTQVETGTVYLGLRTGNIIWVGTETTYSVTSAELEGQHARLSWQGRKYHSLDGVREA
jgi:hypothetical protein